MKKIEEILTGKCLGQYRKELMGIAMIWVMIFHSYTGILRKLHIPVLYQICRHGNLGVEIFLLLSGFGLYYSLSKNDQVLPFYKRRLIRVVLPWLILSCPYWIVKSILVDKDSIGIFILNWFGLSFWTEGITTVWYIAFIILLYAIYPFVFYFQRNNRYAIPLLIGGSILFNIVLLFACPEYYDKVEVALSRIPVFLLGSYIGESIYQSNRLLRNKKVYCYLFILLLLYIYPAIHSFFGFPEIDHSVMILIKRLRGQIVGFAVIFLSCWLFMSFKLTSIKRALAFVGALTLEEYMLHVFMGNVFHRSGITAKLNLPMLFLLMTLILVAAIVISFVFAKVFDYIIKSFEERKKN